MACPWRGLHTVHGSAACLAQVARMAGEALDALLGMEEGLPVAAPALGVLLDGIDAALLK